MEQSLYEQVQRRAGDRCEYCRVPREFDPLRFQVDHIVARKHRGPTELDNLAWSCFPCNSFKRKEA